MPFKYNFMNKLMSQCLLAIVLSVSAMQAIALEYETLPDIKEGNVSIKLQEPERTVGYTVGDILTRTFLLEIKKAKAEFKTSRGDYQYKALLGDRKPALNYRD